MKISATWSSSRIATRVSWPFEEMIISLLMPTPRGPLERRRHIAPLFAAPYGREQTHEQRDDAAQRGCRERVGHFGGPSKSSGFRLGCGPEEAQSPKAEA